MSDIVSFANLGCDFCGRAADWLCYPCRSVLCRLHKKRHRCARAALARNLGAEEKSNG